MTSHNVELSRKYTEFTTQKGDLSLKNIRLLLVLLISRELSCHLHTLPGVQTRTALEANQPWVILRGNPHKIQVEAESGERTAAVSLIFAPEPSAILLALIGSIPAGDAQPPLSDNSKWIF